MKKLIITGLFLVFAILPAVFAAEESKAGSLVDSIALISDYSGESKINQDGKWVNVSLNMPVYEGAEFATKADSFLEITFDDATIVRLESNSNLKLSEMKRDKGISKTIFNLTLGKILAVVDKLRDQDSTFEVHTKMAIAAVKGTELGVSASDDGSDLGVFDGVVDWGLVGNFIKVEKGKELSFGKDGKPSDLADLKRWIDYKARFDTMREEISVVRELKAQGGDAVIQWRIKKKQKDTGLESETQATLGGVDKETTQKAHDQIQDVLKKKVRKELANLREHAAEDLKFVQAEMKADFHLGKSMIDVHGNRVRMEEYVFRPAKNEIDLLSLTFRNDIGRLDYLRAQNIFNADLPRIIPASAWNDDWYVIQPKLYRTSERLVLSNTIDRIVSETTYSALQTGSGNHWWIDPADSTLKVSNKNTGAMETIYSAAYDTGLKKFVPITGYSDPVVENDAQLGSARDLAWTTTEAYTITVGAAKTRKLITNLWLINDYGQVQQIPNVDDIPALLNILFNTNVEMEFKYTDASGSSLFELGSIDVISKILWWSALNTQD